ncbi:MAG TPA: peptidoglycan DD-metalloendopeptidase family protein, partial [Aquella sp.]|nr:peptidoglycan DD-metalloendopeptidase family protein [Aquella sp.]
KLNSQENHEAILAGSLKMLGIWIFLSVTSCATRSTPPAQVVNASKVPAYAQTTTPAAATPQPTASTAKLEAVPDDEQVQATTTTPAASATPAAAAPKATVAKPADNNDVNSSGWNMPTTGTLGVYSVSSKGVDITGVEGQPINAVADGKVLYSGNGLKGYGNLIIIRHDNSYLSAYAYNKTNLVKEGAMVKQGQNIATMGHMGSNPAMLHFEVRKNGKPVDPHTMLGG